MDDHVPLESILRSKIPNLFCICNTAENSNRFVYLLFCSVKSCFFEVLCPTTKSMNLDISYGPNLERFNRLQEQFTVTLLDPRNMTDLNCIPPDQHDQGWALRRGTVIAVIDEVKNSDASIDVNNSIEDVNDFLVAAAVNSVDLSSA